MPDQPHTTGPGRREFCTLAAGAVALPALMGAGDPGHRPQGRERGRPGHGGHGRRRRVAFYASTGPLLTRYRGFIFS